MHERFHVYAHVSGKKIYCGVLFVTREMIGRYFPGAWIDSQNTVHVIKRPPKVD